MNYKPSRNATTGISVAILTLSDNWRLV